MIEYSPPQANKLNRLGLQSNMPLLLLFVAVLFAALCGIWSRPVGFLATVWPANAVMLSILLYKPQLARSYHGWLAGAIALMLADLLTESAVVKAAILNSANLLSVGVAYLVLAKLPADTIRLKSASAILFIALAAALGGCAAGVIGGIANPMLFDGSIVHGFALWWVTEVMNYLALLPILLSAPALLLQLQTSGRANWHCRRYDLMPAASVLLSCAVAMMVGGEGAIALPILPLLWCALVYPLFPTAVLTLLCSLFAQLVIYQGLFVNHDQHIDAVSLVSERLGITVVAITPILLAIINHNRNELLTKLRYLNMHDSLTGVRNRAAFYQDAQLMIERKDLQHAVMMVDLDHFKSVNDQYGHASGDSVLREVARRMALCLRPADTLARMGGEEFAIALHNIEPQAAIEVAERIRIAIAKAPFQTETGTSIDVTASLGLKLHPAQATGTIDSLLADADNALYQSKNNGRNRVTLAT